jgi:sugar phosphate isomerase/epimerase
MSYPRLSISETTTHPASYEEDLAAYATAGLDGIAIWEYKLPAGRDEQLIDELTQSKLQASLCVPFVPSIVPEPFFPEPREPIARRKELCAAIRRFAPFNPSGIMVLTGPPGDDPVAARRHVVEGLRAAADVAGEVGIPLGLEPYRKGAGSMITTLPETIELIDEIGAPNIQIIYDTWHFWDQPGVLDLLRLHVDRFICIQVNDWREPVRSWADRVLPGDGKINLPAIFGILDSAGYKGWYDIEVFSDNGSFGNTYPDSIWNLEPLEVARRSLNGFRTAWDRRQAPSTN